MKHLILVACLLTFVSSVHAGLVIADFDFESGSSSADSDALTVASILDSTNVSGSIRALPLADPSISGSGNFLTWGANDEDTASDSYLSFDISLAAGTTEVTFEQLTVDFFVGKTLSGGAETRYDYNLYSSIDNFAAAIDGLKTGPAISGSGNQSATASITFDLSGLATQTTATTFRLDPVLATSAANGNGTQRFGGVDNIIMNGTAAVPEPNAALSVGLLAVVFGGLRRSRRFRLA